MKKLAIGIGVTALLAGVVFLSMRPRSGNEIAVYSAKAEKKPLLATVRANGAIAPAVKVNLSSNISGTIEKLSVREGDAVKAGDPLVRIDPGPYRTEVQRLEANLRMAEIGVREQDVALRDARATRSRRAELHRQGLVSAEEHDRAIVAEESAAVRLESAREAVAQSRAALAKAKDELSKTDIHSPIAGLVTELKAEQGENVVAGLMNNPGTVVMVVSDMSRVIGEFKVDEHDVASVKPGQSVKVAVDALPDEELQGKVGEIAQTAAKDGAQQVPAFVVKVTLEKAHQALRPGMTARATIETASRSDAVAVPIQAVLTNEGEKDEGKGASSKETPEPVAGKEKDSSKKAKEEWVFVIESGKAKKRSVTTGLSNERMVEIAKGLLGGEQVVTGPYRKLKDLKDGDLVRIEEEAKATSDKAKGKSKG